MTPSFLRLAIAAADRLESDVTTTLPPDVPNLRLTGSAAIDGTGNALDNTIQGNDAANHLRGLDGADVLRGYAGDDRLDGGNGADRLVGGSGDDIYLVDRAGDQTVELAGDGWDMVRASLSWRLAAQIEALVLTGSAAIDGTGNALDNTIQGNAAANHLRGLDGADVLRGYAGDDRLDGGRGADRLVGGSGNDVYLVNQAGDHVVEAADEGWDTVRASVSWQLGAQLEALVLTGHAALDGSGNGLGNTLQGNTGDNRLSGLGGDDVLRGYAGDDRLDGGSGMDRMWGGLGDDTYLVDQAADRVTELADEGYDTVFASVSWTLGANLEVLVLTGPRGLTGTGNGLENGIQGTGADDQLFGLDGRDSLYGLEGDDRLDGGEGDDRMEGGAGHDGYVVDSSGDQLVEAADGGWDVALIQASRDRVETYVLADYVDEARVETGLQGFAGISLTGNAQDNLLLATAQSREGVSLSGLAGNDYLAISGYHLEQSGHSLLTGGSGNDTFAIQDFRISAGAGAALPLITDFTPGEDRLELRAFELEAPFPMNFADVGRLSKSATGEGVLTGNPGAPQLVLNTTTGALEAFVELYDSSDNFMLIHLGTVAVLNASAWNGLAASDIELV